MNLMIQESVSVGMKDFVLDEHKDALEQYFSSLEGVVLAYLFGSHARGQAWAHSDVAVTVLLEGRPDDERCLDVRMEVIGGLMEVLDTNKVRMVILNRAPPALGFTVLRGGRLPFCRDHQARIEYQVRTANEYLDFEPFLKRYEHALLERARSGHNSEF